MFTRRSLFLAALLLSVFHQQSQAQEPAYYDSLRLVSAMREDEMMLLAVRAAKALRNQPIEQDASCLDRFEYPELTDIPARQISEQMTASEVDDAIRYFQSPGGRKFVRRNELALTGKLAGASGLSAAERSEFEGFKRRPAGRKLLGELITKKPALMTQAIDRVDQHLNHCAYLRHTEAERAGLPKTCKSSTVASLDNVCLASYAAEGPRAKRTRATIDVVCRQYPRELTRQIDLPMPEYPVALRWLKNRELQILIDKPGTRITSSKSSTYAHTFSVASRQPSDPPTLDCLTVSQESPTLAEKLPLSTTVASWRTYRRPGLCLMTARVPKEDVPRADGDMVLQFRRQQRAALPFATSRLALVVQIDSTNADRTLSVAAGRNRLAMIQRGTHMLTGKAAETVLQSLLQQPAELTVTPEGLPGYVIPVRQQDFDFAYAEFSECLTGLKAS